MQAIGDPYPSHVQYISIMSIIGMHRLPFWKSVHTNYVRNNNKQLFIKHNFCSRQIIVLYSIKIQIEESISQCGVQLSRWIHHWMKT